MTKASLTLSDSKTASTIPVNYPVMMQEMTSHTPTSKWKVFLGVFFGFAVILSVTVVLCVYFLRPVDTRPEIYLITIESEQQKIPMEVKMDQQENLEYITTPVLGNSSNSIYILRDYDKGIAAHKDPEKGLCYVAKLDISIEDRTRFLQSDSNQELNGTHKYTVLNGTIHPEVLRFTVGDKIADFCSEYDSRWMIPDDSADDDQTDDDETDDNSESTLATIGARVKRQWGGGWGGNRWGGNRWGGGWGGNRWGGWGGGRWRGGGWGGGRWNRGCDYRCYSVCLLGCYRSCNRVC